MARLVVAALLLSACHPVLRIPGPLGALRDYPGGGLPPSVVPVPAVEQVLGAEPVQGTGRDGRGVARGAVALLEQPRLMVDGQRYRYDCSGMVTAAYASAGYTLGGGSRDLHARAEAAGLLHQRHRPHPGDIAFFDNTYDRDRDGRRDDMLTHVGVVESVDAEGTVTVVHLGSKGVTRLRLNLDRPSDRAVNSQLRASGDRDGGPVLSGQLWRDFGSLWRLDSPD